jgi:putative membrane protein
MTRDHFLRIVSQYREGILISILVIFYTVGIIGLTNESTRTSFLSLSFMNLLLSSAILVISRKTSKNHFILFLVLAFLVGMTAEWIGIHTGYLFGDYYYGENLGVKMDGVPLIIGINWGILTVCSCNFTSLFIKKSLWFSSFVSALLMMFVDVLIEPVAVMSDYWHWDSLNIPLYNYFCWFAVAFPLHFLYFKWRLNEQNKVTFALFCIIVLFFSILNFL